MRRLSLLAALALVPAMAASQDHAMTAELVLESDEVYLGEQFPVQIRVQGADGPVEPDLSGVRDFEVRYLGGAPATAEVVSAADGRLTRTSTEGYVFSYYFSATSAGTRVIPGITVVAGGQTATTQPRRLTVVRAGEGSDFRLAVEASKPRVYVGEGFVVSVTWYIATPVRTAVFVVPFLVSPDIRFHSPEMDTTPSGKYAKAAVNGQEVVVELGEALLSGRPYTTVTYRAVGTALRAGIYQIPPSSVHFEARVERQRQRSLVESLFDTTASGDYRPFVVSSGESTLRVLDLPTQGRPGRFAGHVGRYTVRAQATPREVTVGDPITLTVILGGPPNVADAPPPDLASQPVAHLFDLGTAQPQGLPATTGSRSPEKGWVFTLRAATAGVTEIPGVELPYFDPGTGRYEVARSSAVPIRVVDARVVTARDAEGEPPAATVAAPAEAKPQGMADSYEDAGILRRQDRGLGNLVHRAGVLLALIASAAALAASAALKRGRGLLRRMLSARRTPFRACRRSLEGLINGPGSPTAILAGVLGEVTTYLARRLGQAPGSSTPGDILDRLKGQGAPEGPRIELSDVFRICEAGRYAGYPLSHQTAVEAARRALAACHGMESYFVSRVADTPAGAPPVAPPVAPLLVLALTLTVTPRVAALDQRQARELLAQSNDLYRAALQAKPEGGRQARELARRAAELLEQLVAWRASGGLYYNLGNAYYRAGELGRAILAYRRAQLLTPHDPNLLRNLGQARSERSGAEPAGAVAEPRPPLVGAGLRAAGVAALALAASLLASARMFTRRRFLVPAAVAALALALGLVISLARSEVAPLRQRAGVITSSGTVAREGDGAVYRALDPPLPVGTEFLLLEERRDWYRIRIQDGTICWVPAAGVELVLPLRG